MRPSQIFFEIRPWFLLSFFSFFSELTHPIVIAFGVVVSLTIIIILTLLYMNRRMKRKFKRYKEEQAANRKSGSEDEGEETLLMTKTDSSD